MATISERLRALVDCGCMNGELTCAREAADVIDALVAALEDLADAARSSCDARQFPSLTGALFEADSALSRARGEQP